MTTKPCHRGRTSSGVAIILGLALIKAWNMARKPPPITSARNSDLPGRIIGVILCFPNRSNKKSDRYCKRVIVKIKIFLVLLCHPVEHDDHKCFNKELASLYNAIPGNA